jgi:ankyrin repeat protein
VNKPNSDQQSPLFFCLNWREDFRFGFTLIDRRIDVNRTNKAEQTPLMVAAVTESLPFADIILQKEADVNAKDNHGLTTMGYAAMSGSEEVMDRLLKARAEINAQIDAGLTPLHIAVNSLVSKGCLVWLLKKGANVDIVDMDSQTPLQLAKAKNKTVCVQQLGEHVKHAPEDRSAENVQATLPELRIKDEVL